MNGEKCHYIPKFEVKLIRDGSLVAGCRMIRTSNDAYSMLSSYFNDLAKEHFLAVFLSTKNCVLGISCISVGSINASIVHPRELFIPAILACATQLIIAHNHPSGDPNASNEDVVLTKRLVQAGELLNMPIIDHIIIGDAGQYFSFKEQGLI